MSIKFNKILPKSSWFRVFILSLSLVFCFSSQGLTCSEVFVGGDNPVSARTFDFMFDGGESLISPRGVKRSTICVGENETPYSWEVKYGNVTFSAAMPMKDGSFEMTGVDGINEKGFKVGTFYLPDSQMPKGEGGVVLSTGSMIQYAVDCFENVDDFVADLKSGKYRMISMPTNAVELKLHMYIHDAAGKSAIIEYIDGELVVIENPKIPVLTNTIYKDSIKKLEGYHEFGGDKVIPGGQYPMERFVRGAYYSQHIPKPATREDAVASATSAIMNLTIPPVFEYGCTFWHLITDINDKVVYIYTLHNRNVRSVDLKTIDFSKGNKVKRLDFLNTKFAGDITDKGVDL